MGRLWCGKLETNMSAVDYQDYITFEPGKRSGQPCIRRMRLTVYDVFEYLAGGMSIEEVMDDFPYLTRDDISAICLFCRPCRPSHHVGSSD